MKDDLTPISYNQLIECRKRKMEALEAWLVHCRAILGSDVVLTLPTDQVPGKIVEDWILVPRVIAITMQHIAWDPNDLRKYYPSMRFVVAEFSRP